MVYDRVYEFILYIFINRGMYAEFFRESRSPRLNNLT